MELVTMPKDQDDHVEAYLASERRKAMTVPDYRIALGLAAYRLAVFLAGEGSDATGTVQQFAERLLAPAFEPGVLDQNEIHGRIAVLLMSPEDADNADLRARLEQITKDMLSPEEQPEANASVH
jgi:hypothetical protein